MKHLLAFLLLLCSASVSAQDVIVKKDGSTIVCRVVEVTATEITYKKWSDLNGSNYVMECSAASAINYENGKKVSLSEATNLYTPNNQNDGTQQYNDRALLQMDAVATKLDKKARNLKTTAWIGGGVLFAAGVLFLSSIDNYWLFPDDSALLHIGLACIGGAGIWTTSFLLAASHAKKQNLLVSTPIYQHNYKLSNSSSLSIGADMLNDRTMGYNTLGLGLRYNF